MCCVPQAELYFVSLRYVRSVARCCQALTRKACQTDLKKNARSAILLDMLLPNHTNH